MTRALADSFYFFALLNSKDAYHQKALAYARTYHGELVITAWIVTELGDGLAQPRWRNAFIDLIAQLRANSRVLFEPCTNELLDAGIELYRKRPDKGWSLTDCVSFVVMQREGIREALTGDAHFEQAGFIALLK